MFSDWRMEELLGWTADYPFMGAQQDLFSNRLSKHHYNFTLFVLPRCWVPGERDGIFCFP